jgi:large subunit ribosomal protein L24
MCCAVFPSENRALVQGVNMVKRHQRQTAQTEGGIINREVKSTFPIWPLPTRKMASQPHWQYKLNDDGTKSRIAKRSGEVIDG